MQAVIGKGVLMLAVVAGGIYLVLRLAAGIGSRRLPGDVAVKGKHGTMYISVIGSLLLTLVISLILWLINKIK